MKLALIGIARTGSSFILDILSHDPEFLNYIHEPLSGGALGFCNNLWRYRNHAYSVFVRNIIKTFYGDGLFEYVVDPQFMCFDPDKGDDDTILKEYLSFLIVDRTVLKFINILFRTEWLMNNYPDLKIVFLVRHPFSCCHSLSSSNRIGVEKGQAVGWTNTVHFHLMNNKRFLYKELSDCDLVDKALIIWSSFYDYAYNLAQKNNLYIMKYEDVCEDPLNTFTYLYNSFNKQLPKEVEKRIKGSSFFRSDAWFGQQIHKVSNDYLERGEEFWIDKARRSSIYPLMEKYGYD